MIRRSSSIILVILFSIELIAQTDFRPGYIVKISKDTIYGEIDYRDDLSMNASCTFRESVNGKEGSYLPADLIEYRIANGKYFISKSFKNKNYFFKILLKGEVTVLHLKDIIYERFFLENESLGLNELEYQEKIVEIEDITYQKNQKRYIGLLNAYLKDSPSLKSRIINISQPTSSELVKLVSKYHEITNQQVSYPLETENQHTFGFLLEPAFGGIRYYNTSDVGDKIKVQIGIIGHIGIPRISEKVFLKTGIVFSGVDNISDDRKSTYKFPILFEYIYPKGKVRPRIAYGISLYSPFAQTVSFSAGINIPFQSNLSFTLNLDSEFHPTGDFPLFPKQIQSHTINMGFLFNIN